MKTRQRLWLAVALAIVLGALWWGWPAGVGVGTDPGVAGVGEGSLVASVEPFRPDRGAGPEESPGKGDSAASEEEDAPADLGQAAAAEVDRAFARIGRPARVRPYPRGENSRRRFPEVRLVETSEKAREAPPLAMAMLPGDGRLELRDDEKDLHTARALRMVLAVEALERVVAGETANLLMPLPDGAAVGVRIDRIRDRGGMTYTLEGEIPAEEQSSVVQLVLHDGIVHGALARYDEEQHVEYTILPSGHMAVRELDATTMTSRCGDPGHEDCDGEHPQAGELAEDPGAPDPGDGETGEPAPDTPGFVTMDVVVGYGREARLAQGGVSQMEARIIASVDRMNTAFGNSLVADTELMLLGTIEDPDYVFPGGTAGNMGSTDELGDLNSLSDGILDAVSDYATDLGADLRTFVVKQADGSAGVAYRPGRSAIVARDYMATNRITFAHELGHNIGARHSWGDTSSDSTTTVHNYGWRLDPPSSGKVRTVMSYDWGWTRIPYFANPNVEYLGARTGQVDGYDATADVESDPRYVSGGYTGSAGTGFDGSNPSLGARNADYLQAQAPFKADDATRTAFEVAEPAGGDSWQPGTVGTIYWRGGDYTDVATIELFKGGVLDTTIATGLRGDERRQSWAVPAGQAPGSDYMIRVTLNGGEVADGDLFSIRVGFPRVVSQSPEATVAQAAGQTQVSVTFGEPIDTTTFSLGDDVVSFTGPQGADLSGALSGATWSGGDTVLTLTFAAQSGNGVYRLVLGPNVSDLDGNAMDQDDDGVTGEPVEDQYAAIFWIATGGGTGTIWSDLEGVDGLDAGWTLSGGSWATGTPAEVPTAGPNAGADGNPILAQNLAGNYGAGESSYAESPVIDCSGATNVSLSFQGWKGAGKNDTLYVDVFDGASWQRVYSFSGPNGGAHDTLWTAYAPSVSAYADGNANFRIRWGLDDVTVGNSKEETGWQLDAIVVAGDGATNPPPAPLVVSHSPSGSTEDPQSSWYLEFSQPMDPGSFSPGDIAQFTGPAGALSASGFTWISDTVLRVDFSEQSALGTYTLVLAPSLLDAWAGKLDQDTDGTAGESTEDRYLATFTISGELTAPAAPSGLAVAALSDSAMDLSWIDSSDNETGFRIQWSPTGGGSWTDLVTTTAAEVTTYGDTGLAPGTTRFYQVIAFNGAGDSAPSNEASATTWTQAEAWRQLYFGQTADSGVAADNHDADGDGSANLFERAFATVPTNPASYFNPIMSKAGDGGNDYLAITYRRLQGAGSGITEEGYAVQGITYTVRRALSLSTGPWETGSALLQEVSVVDNGDGTDSVTVRNKTPVTGSDHEFMLLEVTGAP